MQQQEYRLGYRADLEGLRGIAILLVVAVHAGIPWLQGGFVGVDVFFVLSGFLITGLLLREIRTTGKVRLAEFYVRRLRRLLPAMFLMLIVVCVCAVLVLTPAGQRPQLTLATAASFWGSNIYLGVKQFDYFNQAGGANWFLHTWSLGVEEQFYLIWPALLVWLLRRGPMGTMRRLKLGMWVVVAASLGACIALTYTLPQPAFYMMPTRAWQFAAGALVWIYFMEPGAEGTAPSASRTAIATLGWFGLALIGVASVWLNGTFAYPGAYALLPTVGAVAIIVAGCRTGAASGASQLLSAKPLQWIGHISYSWYLWHWPILMLGKALTHSDAPAYRAVLIGISFLVACASYFLVESPIRHQKHWLRWPRATIAGALAVMTTVGIVGIVMHRHAVNEWAAPKYRTYAAASEDWPAIYHRCDADGPKPRICTFGPQDAGHTAVLIGDSHAMQWYPAAHKVFDRPNWRLLVVFLHGCPMVIAPDANHFSGEADSACVDWRTNALADIAKIKPDIVLIGSAWWVIPRPTKQDWLDGTLRVLRVLSPVASHIYILRDTPKLPFNGAYCLAERASRPNWLQFDRSCRSPMAADDMSQVHAWVSAAMQPFPNVSMIDMNQFVCPDGICKAEQDGTVVYLDSNHLTAKFSAMLAPELGTQLGFVMTPNHEALSRSGATASRSVQ